jgi:alkylhydroperoxidase family enzyme
MDEAERRVTPGDLLERILRGPGTASQDLRARAFNNADVPEPIRGLIDKVANRSAQITDADFADAATAGFDDEQLIELVICAAVGQANRQYEAAQAALAEATGGRRDG